MEIYCEREDGASHVTIRHDGKELTYSIEH